MKMFSDDRAEKLIDEYMDDRPMMFGSSERDEIKETIRKLKDAGISTDEMTVDELRRIHLDKDFKFK